jgi:hypothetical protein
MFARGGVRLRFQKLLSPFSFLRYVVTAFLDSAVFFILSGPSSTGLMAHYAFISDAPLLDLAFSLGDLQAVGNISYCDDGPWPGSQSAVLTSGGDSSGGGQYFRVRSLNLGAMSESTGFSICTWFVFDATRYGARIFDFGQAAGNSVLSLSRSGMSDQLQLQYSYCGSYTFPSPIINGQWRHVCVVNQGSSWSIYDDGVSVGSRYCSLNNVILSSNFIGRSNYYYSQLLVGRLGEFLIYRKALVPSDVTSIYIGPHFLSGRMCLC